MPNQKITMDDGGGIRDPESTDILETEGFGGCSAIAARTNGGMFALYHLRSIEDHKDYGTVLVKGAKDSNEPYRNWVTKLKEAAQGQTIYFTIGTPRPYLNNTLYQDEFPNIGMERYLRYLCEKNGITNYEIALVNMGSVARVTMSQKGMTCYDCAEPITPAKPHQAENETDSTYNRSAEPVLPGKTHHNESGGVVIPQKTRYQTDEEILDNAPWSNQIKLNGITENMDMDHKLRNKYTPLRDQEKDLDLKQQRYKQQIALLKHQDDLFMQKAIGFRPEVNALKAQVDDRSSRCAKGDERTDRNQAFVTELNRILNLNDREGLQSALMLMKNDSYFAPVFNEKGGFFLDENRSIAKKLNVFFTTVEKSLGSDQSLTSSAPLSL